jgi:putative MFS transporter
MTSGYEIGQRLERLPTSRRHYELLALHGTGWFFQAVALGVFPFVLTALAVEWALSPGMLGLLASLTILGILFGAVFSGTLADLFGRRKMFMATFFVFTFFSILSALAWDPASLGIFRVGVGFGLGGGAIVAASLLTELTPSRRRGWFVSLLETFWVSGATLAAVVAFIVVPTYGWRAALLLAGIPVVATPVLWRFLLESPRWLATQNRLPEAERLVSTLERQVERSLGHSLELAPVRPVGDPIPSRKFPFAELWSGPYRARTVMLWLMWFGMSFGFYGIFTWLPTLLVAAGFTAVRSFFYTMVILGAQIPGALSAAFLVERVGRKWTLAGYLLLSALGALLYGRASTEGEVLMWGSVMAFFNLGAWGIAYAYAAELYPTHARGTGSGSASAFGRIGAVVAPTITGAALGVVQVPGVFVLNGGMFVLAALAVAVLGIETKGRALEEQLSVRR